MSVTDTLAAILKAHGRIKNCRAAALLLCRIRDKGYPGDLTEALLLLSRRFPELLVRIDQCNGLSSKHSRELVGRLRLTYIWEVLDLENMLPVSGHAWHAMRARQTRLDILKPWLQHFNFLTE